MLRQLLSVAALALLLALGLVSSASAQTSQVKPWFLLVVDTSGSMNDPIGANSCGFARTKMGAAKCAIRNILNANGDAEFGIMRFNGSTCNETSASALLEEEIVAGNTNALLALVDGNGGNGELSASGFTPLGGTLAASKEYFEGTLGGFNSPTDGDNAVGCRPINVILLTDGAECCSGCQSSWSGCPDAYTEHMSDMDSVGGACQFNQCTTITGSCPSGNHFESAPERAGELYHDTVVPTGGSPATVAIPIKTYVIGFGIAAGDERIERIAIAGHTDAPGADFGFYAADETSLSAALTQIILDAQLREDCNGIDDDCDFRIDEDHPKYCDINNIRQSEPEPQASTPGSNLIPLLGQPVPGEQENATCAQPEWDQSNTCSPANILCESPGEECNTEDDDCDGLVDENAPPSGGLDDCNLFDDDCDGAIDEDCVICGGQGEICDGMDNDCDTIADEDLSRPCGTDVGICTAGQQVCQGAVWGADLGSGFVAGACLGEMTGSTVEDPTCDEDDDDCDGINDEGVSQQCDPTGMGLAGTGECTFGTQVCVGPAFGPCIGGQGPTNEICDTLDNDCDGPVDESPLPPDPENIPGVGVVCGNANGICDPGLTECIDGVITCTDDDSEAQDEVCDGIDNDCDGFIDENPMNDPLPQVNSTCYPTDPSNPSAGIDIPGSVTGECALGTVACVGGALVCLDWVGPSDELCDPLDHDCNGDPLTVLNDPIIGQPCGTSIGVCEPGVYICDPTTLGPLCNGVPPGLTDPCGNGDEDCDGSVDEDAPTGNPCDPFGLDGIGLCRAGTERCINGQTVCDGAIGPSPEICDNENNDCDGATDESVAPDELIPGVGDDCVPGVPGGTAVVNENSVCEYGTTVCSGGQLTCSGGMGPLDDELCNLVDDDCDGIVDEGNPQGGGLCGDVGPCRRATDPTNVGLPRDQPCGECQFGREVCVDGQLECQGDVSPIDEVCNGRDDDCDYPCLIDDSDPSNPVVLCPPECDLPTTDPQYVDCDGLVDEGVDVTDPNVGVLCPEGFDDTGECDAGEAACIDGILVCQGVIGPRGELCNMLDDDCDGNTDEGIMTGEPCGESAGECEPGQFTCDPATGQLVCTGGIGPIDEVCDGLDNDCDGMSDEDVLLGAECGTDVGECMKGSEQCVMGRITCVGQVTPSVEICDCLDNDCDGEIDEETGSSPLCPDGSACIDCQCALPCAEAEEFGAACPSGKAPVTRPDPDTDQVDCWCVGEQCNLADCQENETLRDSNDRVLCAPDSDRVGACLCRDNECTFRCAGVVCTDGLVCNPLRGVCEPNDCRQPQFPCPEGERCRQVDGAWGCVDDPCAGANCAADEACRDGNCVKSCATVECSDGNKCVDGNCVVDECAGVNCDVGEVCDPDGGGCVVAQGCAGAACDMGEICNPVSGDCAEDPCVVTDCPFSQRCNSEDGQCELRCGGTLIYCGEDAGCIDRTSNREFCGASRDCQGDNAGEACGDGLVCADGSCSEDCPEDRVKCEQDGEATCIDPQTDRLNCGASGNCEGGNAGEVCGTGTMCTDGACVPIMSGGAGTSGGAGSSADQLDEGARRIVATGGGGCACTVPGSTGSGAPASRGPLSLSLLVLGLLVLGRRRARRLLSEPAVRGLLTTLLLLAVASLGGGCKVDTFCLDCPSDGEGGRGSRVDAGGDAPGFGNVDGGGNVLGRPDGSTRDAGPGGDGTDGGDAGGGGTDGCQEGATELCDGIDQDCDGIVDEGADPDALNVDITSDVNHCGACGNRCELDHAFSECVDSECRVQRCDVNFYDLNDKDEDGCEVRCNKTADDDSICDLADNDCDGEVDEDIPFDTSIDHCGSCGNQCRFLHAADGATCNGASAACDADKATCCELDPTKCDEGFHDLDGEKSNGCEYRCTLADPPVELCNGGDDDCDGEVDEGVAATDTRVGVACGTDTGECVAGVRQCRTVMIGGQRVTQPTCVGEVTDQPEECDGLDNDCDGDVDENDPRVDAQVQCGTALGLCERGFVVCNGGSLGCEGGTGATDEVCNGFDDDCDGRTDEVSATDGPPVDVGLPCRTNLSNGTVIVNPGAATGLCVNGTTACSSGSLVCMGEAKPSPEQCDTLDHDCDGSNVNGVDVTDPDIGGPCGVETGECSFGTLICASGVEVCDGGQTGTEETCDGLDNDCDGSFDEIDNSGPSPVPPIGAGLPCIFDSTGTLQYGPSVTATGQCVAGTTTCVGGQVACPDYTGPTAELCDGLDRDCDGNPVNGVAITDNRIGEVCPGNSTGLCDSGRRACDTTANPPALVCQNVIGPDAEMCDGLDNDCDGAADDGEDETWIGIPCKTLADGSLLTGASVPPATGACVNGTLACVGGGMACLGETRPANETCDKQSLNDDNPLYDQDCDGRIDENFNLDRNTTNCGFCGNDCNGTIPNAVERCTDSACVIARCDPGFYDTKEVPDPQVPDCDVTGCTFTGSEICDGADNDCDGIVDEQLSLPPATSVCLQIGACAAGTVECRTYVTGDVTDTDCTGVDDPDCTTSPVCTQVGAAEVCDTPFNDQNNPLYDNDCDGQIDEGFGLGAECAFSGAVGACATVGELACDLSTQEVGDTFCADMNGDPVVAGSPGGETCNGLDDDCDGLEDEPCGGAVGTDPSCVTDAWVQLPSGAEIYMYEASRPDASPVGSGTKSGGRSCSNENVLPWTNVTLVEAQAACAAADPDGRVCTDEEWAEACELRVGMSSCDWSFSDATGCTNYSAVTCNGFDYSVDPPIQPSGRTGFGATNSQCFREHPMGDVHDLSGNVKELVDKRLDGTIRVRGGAYNNSADGISCGFDFTVWPDDDVAEFTNVGFRCCRGALPPTCMTIRSQDTFPIGPNSSSKASTLVVPSLDRDGDTVADTVMITDVDVVSLQGDHTDYDDISTITLEAPSTTVVNLQSSAQCGNGDNGFDLAYDDEASGSSPSCSTPVGGGVAIQPSGALSDFAGENPVGTWTLTMTDTVNNDSWQLDGWGLRICAE